MIASADAPITASEVRKLQAEHGRALAAASSPLWKARAVSPFKLTAEEKAWLDSIPDETEL